MNAIEQFYVEYDIADLMRNVNVERAKQIMASDFGFGHSVIDALVEHHNSLQTKDDEEGFYDDKTRSDDAFNAERRGVF